MNKNEVKVQLKEYERHLFVDILPFWLNNAIDQEFGGYYTCFSNDGKKLISRDKYVWSQGRLVWIFSKLYELTSSDDYLKLAKLGVDFLRKNCFLPNGNCAFLLSREGQPKEPVAGSGYDTSIYVDCFVVMGLAKYGKMSGDSEVVKIALSQYDSILDRVRRGSFRTDPYPIPRGYRAHAIPMILLNTSQELGEALSALAHPAEERVRQTAKDCLDEILGFFIQDDGTVLEMVHPDLAVDESIIGRYVNPGHTIEDMWFVMREAISRNDRGTVDKAAAAVERAFMIGWDPEFGGLFAFVDKYGLQPRGNIMGFAEHPMLFKLQNDWDNKLWWVHSEALFSTLLGYHLTGNSSLLRLYEKTRHYTFHTFPNPDRTVGEWIQIRDRQGKPVEKIVALPVKDPYHIARNLILIIELLRDMLQCMRN